MAALSVCFVAVTCRREAGSNEGSVREVVVDKEAVVGRAVRVDVELLERPREGPGPRRSSRPGDRWNSNFSQRAGHVHDRLST